jgi:3-deoxy-D-manno-octulosonic-acid transferase
VHSVLEAAVHGVPILTGPRFRNSPEAVELVEKKLVTPVAATAECQKVLLDFFQNPILCQEKGRQHREFVLARCGAATQVLDRLVELLHNDHRVPMPSR